MSQNTIDIMNTHRDNQLKLSPSSELFQIVDGVSFYGIFDRANFASDKDAGNVKQKYLRPMIQVSTVPETLIERESKITREDGLTTYTFFRAARDDEGVSLLWLS